MNILFVHEIGWMRDPIWEMHTLSELLSLRKHNVYAADFGATRYQETDVARVHPDAKVHLIRPPSFGLGRLMYGVIYNVVIYTILQKKKIDVVILYSAPTNGIQTILAAKRLRIPVVFRSIDVLHKLVPKSLALPAKLAEGWVYRHVDKILTITPALSRYMASLGASPDKVGLLPLGIDIQPLREPLYAKNSEVWGKTGISYQTMVFAGGTMPLFIGLDDLVEQMPSMMDKIPHLRLLIIGDGALRPKLETMVQEMGLRDCVKLTGMVPHSDVPKWIDQADVGILPFPSDGATRDIFPTKVLQYMAQGKPVVANPLPGLVDFGLGEEQGVVYTRDGDWGSAVEYAIQNRDVLGEKARRYVEQEHGYDQIVRRLEKELEELCKSR